MTGTIFQVNPGSSQQFTGAPLDKGATVWNIDLVNSVWISSERYMTPGNALELPAQASCQWTGKQLFACVDTGNTTTPVNLQISNDATNITNPVGIAEAIAIAGIPSTYLNKVIFNKTMAANEFDQDIPIAQYASLLVTMFASVRPNNALVNFVQTVAAPFTQLSDYFYASSIDGQGLVASLPVSGNFLSIRNDLALPAIVVVLGTNRPIDKSKLLRATNTRTLRFVGAVTINVPVDIPTVDGTNEPQMNGQVSIVVGPTIAGSLVGTFLDDNGNAQIFLSVVLTATQQILSVTHPVAGSRWQFVPSATGALTLTLAIIPQTLA